MTADTGLGTLERQGDQWRLTFARRLAHPQELVWQAVTEPEHLAAWFPQQVIGERKAGAHLRFEMPGGDGFDGEMLVFDPPHVCEFTWGTDRLRIELHPEDGGTALTMTHTFGDLRKAARDGASWHVCLQRLMDELDGAVPQPWDRWREVHPAYVEAFGPDASTVGPPPPAG
ncbi:MAG TPA: SRPBCC family protein [Streptosporangiaceae bacterium]|nr:SRPBCC family protein [Streptosporangiaceae bacterium]